MYSPTFLVDYLMNDEWAHIGMSSDNIGKAVVRFFFEYGRGLFGVYERLVYSFVEYDPFRIQLVRFLNFASIAAIAVILLKFLEIRSNNSYFAFFVILLLFSQQSFQGMMGYSLQLISNTQPSMWLSLLAFYLHFFVFVSDRFFKPFQVGVVFLLLILAMQSTQTYAFFAMVPLTYLLLTDWENRKRKILSFLIISIIVFLLSTFVYKFGLEYWHSLGRKGYTLGEQSLNTAVNEPIKLLKRIVNPFSYWSAFKIWSYPFPFHYTFPLYELKKIIASYLILLWIAFISGAIITEIWRRSAGEKWQVFFKWLTILVCLGFGAIFLIADSPQKIIEHRPHMTLTFTGVVIFSWAYSLQVLSSKYSFFKNNLVRALGIILVLMIAFGAQAGVLRGIVNNRMEQISYIRTELMTTNPSEYKNIIVVLPRWGGCVTEPCGPWMGKTIGYRWHMTRKTVYRYALTTIGVPLKEKKYITFVHKKPDTIPKNSVIIDWNKYAFTRKQYLEYLRQNK
jgi:hypothetical protein